MHILIAPNAFKHSLDAGKVASAIDLGLKQSSLSCTTTVFPIGDGGDGTGSLIIDHLNGEVVNVPVKDPLQKEILSSYGLINNGKTAVIEMADASGLRLLKEEELDPLKTTSFGTGQLIKDALERKVKKILMCIGGSATVDGATGILQALGFRFFDKQKNQLTELPRLLPQLDSIDTGTVDPRAFECDIEILCDVENKLLGINGAAAVFGPQKGASNDDVKKLEEGLTRLREVILKQTGKDISQVKHGGAAGGVAAGLWGLLNARLVNGIDHFLMLTGFEERLAQADAVITAEGSIDEQTLQGKGPFGVAKRAKEKKLFVIGLAGKIPGEQSDGLREYFDVLMSINEQPMDLAKALPLTQKNLIRTAEVVGNMLASKKG